MTKKESEPNDRLDAIATEWSVIHDPAQFVRRYSPAVQTYLAAIIKNPHDAEDVAQDFFLRVAKYGFVRARKDRGRFRDYLKTAVRNAAINFLRRKQHSKPAGSGIFQFADTDKGKQLRDQAWIAQWRQCLLDRARKALEKHQTGAPGNLFSTVLNLLIEYPRDDAKSLAARTSALTGRPLRPDAFRKQVSRARFMLAKLLVREVIQTLDRPTPAQVKEELIDLSLWEYVRDFLPPEQAQA
jgi:RNA polymerase sigma factor (sigma-70 family)